MDDIEDEEKARIACEGPRQRGGCNTYDGLFFFLLFMASLTATATDAHLDTFT
jgi:hypothetical protein